MDVRPITVEEAWPSIQPGIDNIIALIEDVVDEIIPNAERAKVVTATYNICISNLNRGPECQKLYDRHNQIFEDYISTKVLPNLMGKEGDVLLQEVVKRWVNHQYMTIWTTNYFFDLDQDFIPSNQLPTLQESSYSIFHKRVLGDPGVMESIMHMIHRIRMGNQRVNQDLLKRAIDIYVDIGKNYYENDFEEKILEQTHYFYSLEALNLIHDPNISYQDYMLKLDESLLRERHWAGLYLKEDTRKKLLKAVNHELVTVHSIQLEEKRKRRRLG